MATERGEMKLQTERLLSEGGARLRTVQRMIKRAPGILILHNGKQPERNLDDRYVKVKQLFKLALFLVSHEQISLGGQEQGYCQAMVHC